MQQQRVRSIGHAVVRVRRHSGAGGAFLFLIRIIRVITITALPGKSSEIAVPPEKKAEIRLHLLNLDLNL
jgi:hypothetical protein